MYITITQKYQQKNYTVVRLQTWYKLDEEALQYTFAPFDDESADRYKS